MRLFGAHESPKTDQHAVPALTSAACISRFARHVATEDALVIVFNPAFLSMDVFMREIVCSRYANCTLVELAGPTRGAAETVLFGLQGLPEATRKRPCMLCDGDCFYTADIVSMYRKVCATHNGTFTFHDTQPKPIYSYVTVEGSDEVTDIKEKVKISDHANTGCYCFKDGVELEKYCKRIIEAGAMQLSQDQKGEFYTSGVIKAMLDDKIPCKMLQLPTDKIHVLGTPTQLKTWCAAWPEQPAARIVFGVERTLLMAGTLEPIARNVGYLRQLHEQGHSVVLAAPRSTPTAQRVAIAARLAELAIPYAALEFSLPDADMFVDHAAVDALQGDLASYVGFYPTSVACQGPPPAPSPAPIGGAAALVGAAAAGAAVAAVMTAAILRR